MPGPQPPPIILTGRQQKMLVHLARRRSSTQGLVRRARIVLAAAEGYNNEQIARRLGINRETARLWRKVWLDAAERLAQVKEETTGEKTMRRCIEEVLADAPRGGAPPTFTPEQICRIVTLACEDPRESGRPVTHWSTPELADEAVKRGIVESISARSVGLYPSSFHRRVQKLGRFLEALRRTVLVDLVGDPETLLVDSTLIEVLHPRQVAQSAGMEGAAWVRWGTFSLYGLKLHLVCATNRVPICYAITPANVADVCLVEELLTEAQLGEEVARRLFGDLAYRSATLGQTLAEGGILLVTQRADQRGVRQQIEVAFASLKKVFGLGQTLAKTLTGLVIRIVAKLTAYTFGFYVNRLLGRPQGRIKELWA